MHCLALRCKEVPRAGAGVCPRTEDPPGLAASPSLVGSSHAVQVHWVLKKNNPPEARAAQTCEVISSSRARGDRSGNDFIQVL